MCIGLAVKEQNSATRKCEVIVFAGYFAISPDELPSLTGML